MPELAKILQHSLTHRIGSAVAALPIVVGSLYFGGWAFAIFLCAIVGVACFEWSRLLQGKKPKYNPLYEAGGLAAAFALLAAIVLLAPIFVFFMLIGLSFAILFITAYRKQNLTQLAGAGVYIVLPCFFILIVREWGTPYLGGDENFLTLMLLLIFVAIWLTDIFAFAFGKIIGGAKLAPKISPNKTWAGLGGAIIGANATIAIPLFLNPSFFATWAQVAVAVAFLSGVALVAQLGDLFISRIKRKYKVKDTGNIMPGHGGLLDRIDGMLGVFFIGYIVFFALAFLQNILRVL